MNIVEIMNKIKNVGSLQKLIPTFISIKLDIIDNK